MKCRRCGNKNIFYFEKIYCETCSKCYYCTKCAHLTIFKICEELPTLLFTKEKVNYQLNYELTTKQKEVSNLIIKYIANNNIFINAICGAGKTELLFQVVKKYINQNKKVAFVCPRVEVISEIYERFNNAFQTQFAIITSRDKVYEGAMFFLTNHQLVMYKNIFDLVIVDEVDAFPLAGDKVLKNGIFQSLTSTGKVIFMSATPMKIDKSFITLNINKRYHEADLIVPKIIKLKNFKFLATVSKGRWLVFFPTIKLLESVLQVCELKNVIVCHSKVDNMASRLADLKLDFIIFTTAILERGITIDNVNVVVYQSSHDNYRLNTLIQICGRVGRVFPNTGGEILYVSDNISSAMKLSVKYARKINE